ncbi:hypothetical protein EGM88_03565 [Aureibaculum marinum]|uniref:Secreted protein n=1 Tax=Aureibaculum marinum TaxID=2487930 RepID=A0A3N4PJ81_9FLAO|nr:hypothetical protein [Aureibaculum marinum]RPD99633.1 hypothetical protein EGM88_03565 [Aureibaculum marinum]
MKKVIVKISAFLMAFIVLFSTLSFTVQKHICGGKIADVAFFGDLDRCGIPDEAFDNDYLLKIEKESCCKDEVHFVRGSNAKLKVVLKLQDQTQQFVFLFTYTYINLFKSVEEKLNSFLNYSPPIIIKNIQVLYETFII